MIEAIALMVRNKPPEGRPLPTLIVAPSAVLDQWEREILSKTLPKLSCIIYHSKLSLRGCLLLCTLILPHFRGSKVKSHS